jgi:hypothetical protein
LNIRHPYGWKRGEILAVLLALTLGLPSASWAAKGPAKPAPKPFLSPVATINGPIRSDAEGNSAESAEDPLAPVDMSRTLPDKASALKLSKPPAALGESRSVSPALEDVPARLATLQKGLEESDLNRLWEATVENSPVIRFSLEKLALPTDAGPHHSSRFLNKTLNVMITGAAMAGSLMAPASNYGRMGILTAGDVARNFVNGTNKPQKFSNLSATEQIQLAGIVDELKERLMRSYQEYRSGLQALVLAHEATVRNQKTYLRAIESGNTLAMMSAGSAYYKTMLEETTLRQQAKLARIELERLAGREKVDGLELSIRVSDDLDTNPSAVVKAPEQPLPSTNPAPAARTAENPPKPSSEVSTPVVMQATVAPTTPAATSAATDKPSLSKAATSQPGRTPSVPSAKQGATLTKPNPPSQQKQPAVRTASSAQKRGAPTKPLPALQPADDMLAGSSVSEEMTRLTDLEDNHRAPLRPPKAGLALPLTPVVASPLR